MATKQEINKILFVLLIFIVLLVGLFYVREKRNLDLQKKVAQNLISEILPTSIPIPSIDTATGVIRVLPPRIEVKVNEEFTLTVDISAAQKQLDGADVHIKFDPSVVQVSDISTGTYFSSYPRKTIDNVMGSVKVTGFTSTLLPPMESFQTLFTMKLVAKKSASEPIMVEFIKGKTSKSNLVEHKTSKNILGKVENSVVVVRE